MCFRRASIYSCGHPAFWDRIHCDNYRNCGMGYVERVTILQLCADCWAKINY